MQVITGMLPLLALRAAMLGGSRAFPLDCLRICRRGTVMMWLRRVAAAPLALIGLICAIGAVRIFTHDLPDETFSGGVFAAVAALVAGVAVFFLLRPDLELLRQVSLVQLRDWVYRNPLGQAVALYAIAAVLML